jgi:hypothetical protein
LLFYSFERSDPLKAMTKSLEAIRSLEVLKARDVGSDPNKNFQSISAGGEDVSLRPVRTAEANRRRGDQRRLLVALTGG